MLLHKLKSTSLVNRVWMGFSWSREKHRALWASLFINIIRNQNPSRTLKDQSLREVLIGSKLDLKAIQGIDPDFTFKQDEGKRIDEEMKGMFKSGFSLNPIIYQQERILKATVKSYSGAAIKQWEKQESQSQEESEQPADKITNAEDESPIEGDAFKDEDSAERGKKNLFVFIPTFLVTQPIFRYLSNQVFSTYQLYCGCYGTGKSTSFILFHVLLTIINEYTYLEKSKKETKIMRSLQRKKLIFPIDRRMLYFNAKIANEGTSIQNSAYALQQQAKSPQLSFQLFEDFEKTYLEHFFGSSQNVKITLQLREEIEVDYFRYTVRKIKSHWGRDWNGIITVFDQINSLVGEVRKFNEQNQEQTTWDKQRITQLNNRIKIAQMLGNNLNPVILNSSINIEQSLLKRQWRSNQKTKRVSFIHHGGLDTSRLNYTADLATDWGSTSFKHYFLDEFEMKMEAIFGDPYLKVKQKLREHFTAFLETVRVPLYLRYLNFREEGFPTLKFQQLIRLIGEQPQPSPQNPSQSQERTQTKSQKETRFDIFVREQLSEYWDSLLLQSKGKYFQQIIKTFEKTMLLKDRETKLAMVFSLRILAYKHRLSEDKFIVPLEYLSAQVQEHILRNNRKLEGEIDREIYAYSLGRYEGKKALFFDYRAADLYELLSEWIKESNLEKDSLKLFSPAAVRLLKKGSNGIMMELIIVSMLQKKLEAKVQCHQLTRQEGETENYKMDDTKNPIVWKIEDYTHFLQLNGLNKQIIENRIRLRDRIPPLKVQWNKAKDCFRCLIEQAMGKKNHLFGASPLKQNQQRLNLTKDDQDHSTDSITIDFLTFKCQEAANESLSIVIRTYDVATSGSKNANWDKMAKSVTTLNNLKDILNEIMDEKSKGSPSSPPVKASLDLGHCILCFSQAIPQVDNLNKNLEAALNQIRGWKMFACQLDTIEIYHCSDAVAHSGFKQVLEIIKEQHHKK